MAAYASTVIAASRPFARSHTAAHASCSTAAVNADLGRAGSPPPACSSRTRCGDAEIREQLAKLTHAVSDGLRVHEQRRSPRPRGGPWCSSHARNVSSSFRATPGRLAFSTGRGRGRAGPRTPPGPRRARGRPGGPRCRRCRGRASARGLPARTRPTRASTAGPGRSTALRFDEQPQEVGTVGVGHEEHPVVSGRSSRISVAGSSCRYAERAWAEGSRITVSELGGGQPARSAAARRTSSVAPEIRLAGELFEVPLTCAAAHGQFVGVPGGAGGGQLVDVGEGQLGEVRDDLGGQARGHGARGEAAPRHAARRPGRR